MASRYIQDGDTLWFAWIQDGCYMKPATTNQKWPVKPQYYVIGENKLFLEVIDYFGYEQIQDPDYHSPGYIQPKLIPHSHLVKAGEKVPLEIIFSGNPRIKEIETELDILRGRVPTPKGYTIDKSKAKALMTELRKIKVSLGAI